MPSRNLLPQDGPRMTPMVLVALAGWVRLPVVSVFALQPVHMVEEHPVDEKAK